MIRLFTLLLAVAPVAAMAHGMHAPAAEAASHMVAHATPILGLAVVLVALLAWHRSKQ